MFFKKRVSTREEFNAVMANRPRGLAIEQGRCSTAPDAVQQFATAMLAIDTNLQGALTNLGTGVLALDAMIASFQNSSGTLSEADQQALNQIQTASQALVAQATAISTTPPGQTAPVTSSVTQPASS